MIGARDEDPGEAFDGPVTILVVEDEVLVRTMTADTLRSAGFKVMEACNAHEALDLLHHNAMGVKAVVSDIRMPGSLDGVGLARAIRSEHPNIKVVLTSGHLEALDWVEHDGFFHKPYETARLVSHLKQLLD